MNKLLLATALLALTFGACKKNTSTVQLPPVTDTVYLDTNKVPIDTSLTISGIKDIRTTNWTKFSLPLTVTRNSGLEQKVNMTIKGLPNGIKAKYSAISGYTTFNTNLELDVMFAKPGTYPLTIASNTEKGKTTDYNVNLVIDTLTKKEGNNLFLSSIINQISTKDTLVDSIFYMNSSAINNTLENELYLRNIVLHYDDLPNKRYMTYSPINSQYQIMFTFNSNNGTINIPVQEVQGRTVTGGIIKTFTVWGQGMVNIEKGTFEFTYTTEFDDNGTTVTSNYLSMGALQ